MVIMVDHILSVQTAKYLCWIQLSCLGPGLKVAGQKALTTTIKLTLVLFSIKHVLEEMNVKFMVDSLKQPFSYTYSRCY